MDDFFTQENCDRCGDNLHIRTTSWFTEETICGNCHNKEQFIKKELREKGIKDAMEGCGYVPQSIKESN